MFEAKILVIEDEPDLRDLLEEGLTYKGYQVFLARDGVEGIDLFRRIKPDVVLTDVAMPGKGGIEVLHQIKATEPGARVVVMTGYGTEETVIEALRGGAINYLKKPVVLRDLYEVIAKIVSMQTQEVNKEFVLEEKKRIVMTSEIDKIWGVINQLLVCAEAVCGETKVQELGLGLYEIILNAIEHGSLEISFVEKCRAIEDNAYDDLLTNRLSNPTFSHRRVTIDYQMMQDELYYIIKDEGRGFDWRRQTNTDAVENLLNPCGRGIFLARLYLDHVEFKEPGNEVHLVKYAESNGGKHGNKSKDRKGSS
jgi:CheY-like chemotaxis protein/anti-sigma regulatory factor (Ser/Thr protein kinase)